MFPHLSPLLQPSTSPCSGVFPPGNGTLVCGEGEQCEHGGFWGDRGLKGFTLIYLDRRWEIQQWSEKSGRVGVVTQAALPGVFGWRTQKCLHPSALCPPRVKANHLPKCQRGERGSRRAGQEQSLLLAQVPLAGAGARCRGAGWHRALPRSPESIASPEVVGAAPWGARGACRAGLCCAAQPCTPTASSSPWAVVSTGTAWRWKYP